MQPTTLRKSAILIPEGNGPRLGSAGRTAIAILKRDTPIEFRIDGLTRADVLAAKDGLFRFDRETSRDEQARWKFKILRDPEYHEEDDGIIRKSDTDWKMYLHWRPDLAQLLAGRGITLSPWQREWFSHCERIHSACAASLLVLAKKMDMIRPGFHFAKRVEDAWDQNVLRILKYEPREGKIARCHTDRCAITFHIAESADGLRAQQEWASVPFHTPRSPDVLCFSAKQLESITKGAIPALYHEVEDTTGGKRERWAMVFFGKMAKDQGMY